VLIVDNHESLNSSWLDNLKKALEGFSNRCEVRRFDDNLLFTGIDKFDSVVLSGSGAFLSQEQTLKQYQNPIQLVQTNSMPMLGIFLVINS